jgi:hypothetical protein
MTMVKTQTRSPHGDNRRRIGRGSELERDHSMNAAELAAALALPEQHPCTGIHNIAPRSMTSSMLTSGSFLDASRVMMSSEGSLLDDVDQDVGIVTMNTSPSPSPNTNTNPSHAAHGNDDCRVVMMTSQGSLLDDVDQDVGIVMTNPNPSLSPSPSHAAHGNGDCRMLPTPPLSPATTSSTSIPVYPRTTNTNTATTALGASRSNHSSVSRNHPAYENSYDSQSHSHNDDGSYSDDSAVRQARENMEEIRNLHPIQLPVPEEMLPALPRAASVLAEPSIPVPRSSRRVRVGQNSIRRPPDLVRGIVHRFDNNDNGDNDQPPIRRLRPDEMLVRCESCQRYLQLCKSAIVVQYPACGAISPAKSTN